MVGINSKRSLNALQNPSVDTCFSKLSMRLHSINSRLTPTLGNVGEHAHIFSRYNVTASFSHKQNMTFTLCWYPTKYTYCYLGLEHGSFCIYQGCPTHCTMENVAHIIITNCMQCMCWTPLVYILMTQWQAHKNTKFMFIKR